MKRHQCLIKSLDMPKKEVSLKTCQQNLPKLKYKGKDTKNNNKKELRSCKPFMRPEKKKRLKSVITLEMGYKAIKDAPLVSSLLLHFEP